MKIFNFKNPYIIGVFIGILLFVAVNVTNKTFEYYSAYSKATSSAISEYGIQYVQKEYYRLDGGKFGATNRVTTKEHQNLTYLDKRVGDDIDKGILSNWSIGLVIGLFFGVFFVSIILRQFKIEISTKGNQSKIIRLLFAFIGGFILIFAVSMLGGTVFMYGFSGLSSNIYLSLSVLFLIVFFAKVFRVFFDKMEAK